MATFEQFEAVTEAWDRLSRACDDAACCPSMKADAVVLFRKMADSFKPLLEVIEPNYWKADSGDMLQFAADLNELAFRVKKAIQVCEAYENINANREDKTG